MNDFEEYIRQGEPSRKEKALIWQTAIGLQDVDGLKPSEYLIENAKENIEGKITINEVKHRIDSYYKTKSVRNTGEDDRTEEADKVSSRITNANLIRATLDYDFEQEKQFDYHAVDLSQSIQHIAKFISGIWQIHAFGEGNTRTTAVFAIKYLHAFGFEIDNSLFAEHSLYFRNALVRAKYNDFQNNIKSTNEYLMYFFGNLLLGENNILKNRDLHINFVPTENTGEDQEKFPVNSKKFPVNGKKFLVNGKKFPVIGLEIIKLMEDNPNITIIELVKLLDISDRAVKNNINKLKNEGIISRIGSDKTGSWKINL